MRWSPDRRSGVDIEFYPQNLFFDFALIVLGVMNICTDAPHLQSTAYSEELALIRCEVVDAPLTLPRQRSRPMVSLRRRVVRTEECSGIASD